MKVLKTLWLGLVALVVFGALSGALLVRRGFRATATPSGWELVLARTCEIWRFLDARKREESLSARLRGCAARAGNPF